MVLVVEAVYESGVFKPLKKVNLKDGERVRLIVSRKSPRGLPEALEKYIVESDLDLTKILIEERR